MNVKNVGHVNSLNIVRAREVFGGFKSISDLFNKTHINRSVLENLALSGALDKIVSNRRSSLWEIGANFNDKNTFNLLAGKQMTEGEFCSFFLPMSKLSFSKRNMLCE